MPSVMEHLKAAWDELTGPGGQFEMVDAEILGNPMRVFKNAPPSMRFVWELARGYGERDYVVYEDERYSYADIDVRIRALAHALVDRYGVGRGDRVAIAMRNYPEWVIGYWATVSIGAAVVGVNAWWTSAELEYGLTDSSPKVVIADRERLERLAPVVAGLGTHGPLEVIAVRADTALVDGAVAWDDVVRPGDAPADLPAATIDPDDDACIFYTSGTTGFPKGAQLTHRGSISNLMHLAFWATAATLASAKQAIAEGRTPEAPPAPKAGQPVFMAPTPLFHVTANNCLLQPCTLSGGRLVLTYKWDPARALELIEREQVSNFSGVPTMSRELLAHPDWSRRDTSSLQGMGGGGAALQPDLVDKIDKSLAGGAPSTGYGLTETNGIVTANSAAFFLAKPASCGPAMPSFDTRLEDEQGEPLPAGPDTIGVLAVKGPSVIKGYLNRPDATADAIRQGWFSTGDIARIDADGFIYIVDRAKDMVLRGGENVYCSEVETVIYTNDAVAEVAVFGIPDERLGEEVAAAVVLHPGASLTDDELRAHLADRIAKHKIPARIWFLDEPLPRNANGKFVKRDLKAKLLAK
ncbi:MAG: class I adenylate-forming enzyme family protein [Acidimicrobiales bacterium]